MIGEFLIRSNKIEVLTFRVILGSIFYRAIMYAGRRYGYVIHLTANDSSSSPRAHHRVPRHLEIRKLLCAQEKGGAQMMRLEHVGVTFNAGTADETARSATFRSKCARRLRHRHRLERSGKDHALQPDRGNLRADDRQNIHPGRGRYANARIPPRALHRPHFSESPARHRGQDVPRGQHGHLPPQGL